MERLIQWDGVSDRFEHFVTEKATRRREVGHSLRGHDLGQMRWCYLPVFSVAVSVPQGKELLQD